MDSEASIWLGQFILFAGRSRDETQTSQVGSAECHGPSWPCVVLQVCADKLSRLVENEDKPDQLSAVCVRICEGGRDGSGSKRIESNDLPFLMVSVFLSVSCFLLLVFGLDSSLAVESDTIPVLVYLLSFVCFRCIRSSK